MLPSFSEIRSFIETHPRTTFCEIRDHFKQHGNNIITKQSNKVIAFNIDTEFYNHLFSFIKENNVKCQYDSKACLACSREIQKNTNGLVFYPIVLSM